MKHISHLLRGVVYLVSLIAAFAAGAVTPSGTLPLLTIETENRVPVPAKTEPYAMATYTLAANGTEGVEDMSGQTEIRGRGNYTWWGFEKKPYRLKLTRKAALMGMKKSKHFTLLAHADDDLGFMREPMGFWLSRHLGLVWTPDMKPVEVVLNGDYIGLYFLVEQIRVDKDRVNVFDQEDEAETSGTSSDITGGWLCEIDNYDEDPSEQIKFKESNGADIRVTHKSPEAVTPEQKAWLTAQMKAIDKAFYQQDPANRDWQELVDIRSLATYYVIQELMDGAESFHGSCYLYRDRGADKKWVWGPVWDFGNTYNRTGHDRLIYENAPYGQTWIEQIVKFTDFQDAYREIFGNFVTGDLDDLCAYLDGFAAEIGEAAVKDHERWADKGYGTDNVKGKTETIKGYLKSRVAMLSKRWGMSSLPGIPSGIYVRGVHSNWDADADCELRTTAIPGVFELTDIDLKECFKIADKDWGVHNWGGATKDIRMTLDRDQPMIAGNLSQNIFFDGHVARVVFKVDDSGKTATVRLNSTYAGVDDITDDTTAFFTVSGGVLTALGAPVTVYTAAGTTIAVNVTAATLAPGLYIVRQGTRTSKISVR